MPTNYTILSRMSNSGSILRAKFLTEVHCWPAGVILECGIMPHPFAYLYAYNSRMNTTILSSLPGHGQLRRLTTLRSLAVAAQLLTLAAVREILELELDWPPMLLTIAALATVNLFTLLRLRSSKPVSNLELFAQLCVDVLALSILLYYGGGSTNPFVSLYLLPLVIAAATLPGRYTWGITKQSPTSSRWSILLLSSLCNT